MRTFSLSLPRHDYNLPPCPFTYPCHKQPWSTFNYIGLPVLHVSYSWSYTMCSLLWLALSLSIMFSELMFQHILVVCFFLLLNNILLHGYTGFPFIHQLIGLQVGFPFFSCYEKYHMNIHLQVMKWTRVFISLLLDFITCLSPQHNRYHSCYPFCLLSFCLSVLIHSVDNFLFS